LNQGCEGYAHLMPMGTHSIQPFRLLFFI
jgi:hypothetical protein